MSLTISVPEGLQAKVEELLKAENISVEVISGETGDVKVVEGSEKQKSSIGILYAGGWIKCPAALVLAKKLSISPGALGKILDLLEIKIRECSLGCFK